MPGWVAHFFNDEPFCEHWTWPPVPSSSSVCFHQRTSLNNVPTFNSSFQYFGLFLSTYSVLNCDRPFPGSNYFLYANLYVVSWPYYTIMLQFNQQRAVERTDLNSAFDILTFLSGLGVIYINWWKQNNQKQPACLFQLRNKKDRHLGLGMFDVSGVCGENTKCVNTKCLPIKIIMAENKNK